MINHNKLIEYLRRWVCRTEETMKYTVDGYVDIIW